MGRTWDVRGAGAVEHRAADHVSVRRRGGVVALSLALRADRAYFVTAVDSRKAARLARCERVELTSCTVAGAPIGLTVRGRATPIANGRVPGLLRPTGPLFWSWLLYRLRGNRMRFYEVEPTEEGGAR